MKKIYNFILVLVKPIVEFIGKLHFPFTKKKVTGKHYYAIRDNIKVGTVLLSTSDGELSNWINPMKIKHSSIYVGDVDNTGIKYVVEAIGKGIVKTDLVSFLTSKDLVIGCEPKFVKEENHYHIKEEALRLIGVPYDYLFHNSKKAMYCFEAVAHILTRGVPGVTLKQKEIIKDMYVYSFKTFLEDKENFDVVFNSEKIFKDDKII